MRYAAIEAMGSFARLGFAGAALYTASSALWLQAAQAAPSPAAKFFEEPAKQMHAMATMFGRAADTYGRPAFDISSIDIGGKDVAVCEEVVLEKPFCNLRRFKQDTDRNLPKVLLVAPMSGHYATLLRGTVEAMLPDHEIYITDWRDAKNIPLSEGKFGLEDYVDYVQDFIRHIGPQTHVKAVCQPTVATLAAIALMAQNNDPVTPLSLTLVAGPIDTRAAPTGVTKLAGKNNLGDFERNVIMTVPPGHPGEGRKVYPGFVQLAAFMSMNPERHMQAHVDMYKALCDCDDEAAEKLMTFYDEYLAVADLPAEFYLETIDLVFHRQALARGTLEINGQLVDLSAIQNTWIKTIEGGADDISAVGQTSKAHDLLTGLSDSQKFAFIQPEVGHYGTFNGKRFRAEILPREAAFIREAAAAKGIAYDPMVGTSIRPVAWLEEQQTHVERKADRGKALSPQAA